MITTLIVACALVVWEPGAGAVEHDVYEDMIFSFTALQPEMQVCWLSYHVPVTYYVVGIKDDKESVPSDTLTVEWVQNVDWDDDGVVGMADFGLFVAAYGGSDPAYDLDGNGSVGFSDLGVFVPRFGECNSGVVVLPCG